MAEVKRKRRTRVSSKNQITLPVAVLAETRVGPGDNLLVEVAGDGRIVLVREDDDPIDKVIGSMPGLSAAADLEALRDEWER